MPLGALAPNTSHLVRVSATDAAGNVSGCSAPVTVTIDTQRPAAPTGLHVQGGSIFTDPDPIILGSAEAGSLVQIFVDAPCTGSAGSFGSADQFQSIGIPVQPALSSGTTSLYARATDQAGNVGDCSTPLDVDRDTTAPAAPTGLSLPDGTPTADGAVKVRGTAESGSTVTVFRDASCSMPVASGLAASFGDTNGLTVSPPLGEGTYVLRATATDTFGRESSCSTSSVTVVVDTTGPPAPNILQLVTASPTSDVTPRVRGQAELGSTVTVYRDTNGTGGCNVVVGTGNDASDFGDAQGVELTGALAEGLNTLRATATDALGRTSPCSTDSVDVLIDTQEPAPPTALSVVGGSPTSDPTPRVRGSAETGSRVDLFLDTSGGAASCDVPAGSDFEVTFSDVNGMLVTPALSDGSYVIRARATDLAGNVSACSSSSVAVTIDLQAPQAPMGLQLLGGVSPTNDTTPRSEARREGGSIVTLYRDNSAGAGIDCDDELGSGTADDFGSLVGIAASPPLTDGSYLIRATATDSAGNVSPCSLMTASVVVDTLPPAPAALDAIPDGTDVIPSPPGARSPGQRSRSTSTRTAPRPGWSARSACRASTTLGSASVLSFPATTRSRQGPWTAPGTSAPARPPRTSPSPDAASREGRAADRQSLVGSASRES